jgi:hypothetical protein
MTDTRRVELRQIQDRFLKENPRLEDNFKLTSAGPSIKEIREQLFPAWEWWFRDALNETQ